MVISEKDYNKSLRLILLFFHLQSFQILSKIFYITIDTYVKYYTNAESYEIFWKSFQLLLSGSWRSKVWKEDLLERVPEVD